MLCFKCCNSRVLSHLGEPLHFYSFILPLLKQKSKNPKEEDWNAVESGEVKSV